jgi:hypothetical protein
MIFSKLSFKFEFVVCHCHRSNLLQYQWKSCSQSPSLIFYANPIVCLNSSMWTYLGFSHTFICELTPSLFFLAQFDSLSRTSKLLQSILWFLVPERLGAKLVKRWISPCNFKRPKTFDLTTQQPCTGKRN